MQLQTEFKFELSFNERKQDFLNKQASSGKLKYKRYSKSPLRYAGGKSLAAGIIIEKFPNNLEKLVSPFFGGGSLEIAVANELKIPVYGFEIFDILVTYWQEQVNNPMRLYKNLLDFKPTNEEFYRVKEIMKKHWKGEKKLPKSKLAATYYFNSNTSYGPHFLGWPSSVYLQEERYQKMIEKVRDFRAPLLNIECANFVDILEDYKKDFLYCDPPYYLDDGEMFVGMYPHRNFPIHHVGFPHEKLRDFLHNHKGGFILSYNDCETIREWYKDFNIDEPKWQYTFGQGDTRIGKNRAKSETGNHIKKSHELLIWKDRGKIRQK